MTMTYKFPLIDLCGKAPVSSLKPFILMLNNIIVAHNSCVFTVSISVQNFLSSSVSNFFFTCFFIGGSFALGPYALRLFQY